MSMVLELRRVSPEQTEAMIAEAAGEGIIISMS